MKPSIERLINFYVKSINFAKGREHTRWLTDFSKYEKDLEHFERCQSKLDSLNGMVDAKIYCRALAVKFGGWYNPSELGSLRSFRIYREYVAEMANKKYTQDEKIQLIRAGTKFLIEYMIATGIPTLDEYFSVNTNNVPQFVRHVYSGSLDIHFVACFPDIVSRISAYPRDVMMEFLPGFDYKYIKARAELLTDPRFASMTSGLAGVIEKLVSQRLNSERLEDAGN